MSSMSAVPLGLDSTHELHAALFAALSDGVLVVDRQGIILDCNPAFHRRLGYAKDELVGRSLAELDSPEFACGFRSAWRQSWLRT